MIIPPGFAHVQHLYGGQGMPNGAAVTYGVGAFGWSDPLEAAADLHEMWALRAMYYTSHTTTLESTRVKFGPQGNGPFATFTDPIAGSALLQQAPPNVAVLVKKQTAMGGKSGRGRFYLPGIPENQIDEAGQLLAQARLDFQGAIETYLTELEGVSTGMFLLHSASSDPTKVISLAVDQTVATQRRRLR